MWFGDGFVVASEKATRAGVPAVGVRDAKPEVRSSPAKSFMCTSSAEVLGAAATISESPSDRPQFLAFIRLKPDLVKSISANLLEPSHPSIFELSTMPPKRAIGGTGVGRPAPQRGGYARQVINELTSPENRSVVTSLAFFAVRYTEAVCAVKSERFSTGKRTVHTVARANGMAGRSGVPTQQLERDITAAVSI